uniref:Uncharacterized protein n=1 Tax=Oncorhynchus tshawytscha TaxID=74940 RepID=A0AAZ3QL39_ONCTS
MNQSAGVAQNVRRYSSDDKDVPDFGPDRNWKGIAISLLVIMVILSLIGLAIVLLSKNDGAKSLGTQLTLDDLFQREFQVHDPDAKWINVNHPSLFYVYLPVIVL